MERIDLTQVDGKVRHAIWSTRWALGPFATFVSVGELADGRWFAERYGRGASVRDKREGAPVYDGPDAEYYARGTARRWMRAAGGEWVQA